MADKPAAPPSSPIRPRVRSTAAGMARPPLAANVVTVSPEAGGFTLSFYAVPADAFEAPAAQEQILTQQAQRPGGVVDVTLELEPAAKVFLPITTVAGLLSLLTENFRGWSQGYAGELRAFLDATAGASDDASGRAR